MTDDSRVGVAWSGGQDQAGGHGQAGGRRILQQSLLQLRVVAKLSEGTIWGHNYFLLSV